MSDYDRQRLERIRDKLDGDEREWLDDYIRRRVNAATMREYHRVNDHYQSQLRGSVHVVVHRERDDRGLFDKATDFVFGE